jgi:hypothetical protein
VESAEKAGDIIALTTVSIFELLSPIYHRRLRHEERALMAFAREAKVLGLDFEAAEQAAQLMGSLLRLGKPVNALDALICGIAISNNAERLVTSDSDFGYVEKVADIAIQLI